MKRIPLLVAGIIAALPLNASAQQAPNTWVSVYAMMYTNLSGFVDPGSASRWHFDSSAIGGGATMHRRLGSALLLGVDASLARSNYERRDLDDSDDVLGSGSASIVTALATGRFTAGGGGDIGFYITGGVGTVAYNIGDLGGWNADIALQAGTGLQYRFQRNKAIALEWGRLWGYHEEEGLGDGRQTHSALKLSFRFGL